MKHYSEEKNVTTIIDGLIGQYPFLGEIKQFIMYNKKTNEIFIKKSGTAMWMQQASECLMTKDDFNSTSEIFKEIGQAFNSEVREFTGNNNNYQSPMDVCSLKININIENKYLIQHSNNYNTNTIM